MSFFFSLIPAILVLGILIIIHEFGHFIACRLTHVKVEKFSIGFGPEIFHWQGKETRYAVSLFPLGGFVKPAGESVSETGPEGPKPGDYLAAPLLARIFIVVAGVGMNYILAFLLFAAIFMMGRPVPGTVINGFVEGYPAKTSGFLMGDRIVQIQGQDVSTWTQMTQALDAAPEGEIEILVERKSEGVAAILSLRITPRLEVLSDLFGEQARVKRLGVTPHPQAQEYERFGLMESLAKAWQTSVMLTVLTHKALFYLATGRLSVKNMQGPIGIITMAGTAAQLGISYVLQLAANLSISLAVFNLLPVPALDGGHLLFLLIEAIRRKRVSLEVQERATQVGFALLLMLMGVIIYNDLANLNVFEKVKDIFIKP
ncbi:MAG: RIP metalloprotease RseP [Candidatus Omnitrophica bacterium]|nr:RIP metalloprotease RseP [Candidatus Omnitrophota bacterium]